MRLPALALLALLPGAALGQAICPEANARQRAICLEASLWEAEMELTAVVQHLLEAAIVPGDPAITRRNRQRIARLFDGWVVFVYHDCELQFALIPGRMHPTECRILATRAFAERLIMLYLRPHE